METKLSQNKDDLHRAQELMLESKSDMFREVTDMKQQMAYAMQQNNLNEARLNNTIKDSQYWTEKYTEQFKSYENAVLTIKTEIKARFEEVFDQLKARPT